MKRCFLIGLILLLAGCWICAASAWEFTMNGDYEYRYRWFGRTGGNDLFGMAAAQEGAQGGVLIGFAGPNIYNTGALPTIPAPTGNFRLNLLNATGRQMIITRGGFSSSGSDAFYTESRLTLRPTIRINKALKIQMVYTHGGLRNRYDRNGAFGAGGVGVSPLSPYYMSQTSMNASDTAALVSVEQFKGSITLPWGVISIGVKDFPLGLGATFGSNTRSESVLTVVPYGPFRFMHAIWLSRSRMGEAWAAVPDGARKYDLFQGGVVSYEGSTLSVGAAAFFNRYHGDNTVPFVGNIDENTRIGLVFLKYYNGRFFANVEYSSLNIDRNRSLAFGPGTTVSGSDSQTVYIEGYHFFGEAGAVIGPMKFTFMYAVASGPVLNTSNRLRNVYGGGFFLGGATPQPFAPGANPKVYTSWAINYQAMEPYEFLMFNTYAGGNNGGWNMMDYSTVSDDHGMMADAYCFGSRWDYAVAANLNVWTSILWAHRLERAGTYFGQYQSSGSLAAGSITNLTRFYAFAGRSFGTGNDYVSDGFIGWEANVGMAWKLLEGLTFRVRYSYWQPGGWFREAYQSVRVLRDGTADRTAVLVDRDAIQAFQGAVIMSF